MNKFYSVNFLLCTAGLLSMALGARAQSPGGVTGSNTVWLKANIGTTLNPTGNVTTWAEQSGSSITGDFSTHNPGCSGTTQFAPLFVTGGFNFNPYVKFLASSPNCVSSNNLIAGTDILGASEMTMFQVINLHPISTSNGAAVWCKWQTSNTASYRLGDETNTGTNLNKCRLDFRNSGNPLQSNNAITDKQTIYTSMATSTTLSMRFKGSPDNSMTVSSSFSPTGTARLSLGNENETGGDAYPTNIDIAEYVLYKRALTAAEVNKVESYLAIKYGFTLPQTGTAATDYTASDGSITWNHTANAPFVNNITGVARDDNSGFDQRQSLSVETNTMVTMYYGNIAGTFPALNTDNTNAFTADKTYVVFGDNHADTLVTHCSLNGKFSRMNRTWKVQTLGTPGAVTLVLQKANVPPQITTLIVASDPNFTTGVVNIPISDNGTQLYAPYTFTNGQYFTFGTSELSLNPTITDVLCQGNNGSIVLNPLGGTTPLTYSWNTIPAQTTQNLNGLPPGNYTVTVTQANGCSFSESYTVGGNASPIFVKVVDTANTICTTKNGVIEVSGIGGTPFYQYNIDGGPFATQKRFSSLSSGNHTITIKDQKGCTNDTTIKLSNYSYDIDVTTEAKDAWCDADGLAGQVTVNAEGGSQPYGYFWTNLPTAKGPEADNLPKGTYKVTVTDKYGCFGNSTAVVAENFCCTIWIPNAFSPNNDTKNDEFKAISNRSIPRYEMSIFNRYGQRVFYTTNYNEGWNGTYQNDGKPLDVGTYFYRIKYTCEMGKKVNEYHGDLTLIR